MCYTNRAIYNYNDEENSGNGSFSAARRALQNTGGSNMSTKIIASDYDGTLCRDEGITEHDKAAIARWQTAGNLFGLVTGRNIHDALAVTRDPSCGIRFDFVICCSGSIVLDRDGHIIYDGAGESRPSRRRFSLIRSDVARSMQRRKALCSSRRAGQRAQRGRDCTGRKAVSPARGIRQAAQLQRHSERLSHS